ncbi:MAG: hypothetical protein ACYSU3_02270 [Planctomycetota bacterium]
MVQEYAPDRKADILHITIDVTPDFKSRTVAGTTTIKFVPIAKPLTELRLDAIDLSVSSVTANADMAGYNVTDEAITITFEPAISPGAETTCHGRLRGRAKAGNVLPDARDGLQGRGHPPLHTG